MVARIQIMAYLTDVATWLDHCFPEGLLGWHHTSGASYCTVRFSRCEYVPVQTATLMFECDDDVVHGRADAKKECGVRAAS